MKALTNTVFAAAMVFLFAGPAAGHATAKLKDARIQFKTGDKRKRADTRLVVQVYCNDGSIAAKNDPVETYGEFPHYSDNGPIVLVVDNSKAKDDIKGGYHMIKIEPVGNETWTFSYKLTLDFDDGTKLVYGRINRKATQDDTTVRGENL